MFKLVVLCAAVAVAAAKPNVWGNGLGWGSPLVGSSWVGSPVVSSYSSWGASPIVSNLGVAPVVSAYSAVPAVVAASEPALAPGVPAIVTKPTGKLVDTLDVVVNRNNHLVAKNLAYHGIQKRSAVAPLAVATPLTASWGAPVAAPLAAPLAASWASPLASSWGSPLASSWGSPLAVSSPVISSAVVSPLAARTVIASPVRSVVAPIHAW